jgi:hypothetical protein
MRDLHDQIRIIRSISPVAVGTTGTGQTGKIVDRLRSGVYYNAVEFAIGYGTVTATNAAFTVVVKEGDVTGTMTSIADADLIGTEALAGLAAAATRTSGTSKNVTKRLGYTGMKRYVQVSKLSSTITATTPVHADVILGNPSEAPTSNP